jgi:hypothetical protein
MHRAATILALSLSVTAAQTAAVLDTVPIVGHWTQNGASLKRRSMETVLLQTGSAGVQVDAAKGYRAAAFALGATLWTATTVVAVIEIVRMADALEKMEYVSTSVDAPLVALSIGTDIAGFVQARLRAQSDYKLFCGIRAYNEDLGSKAGSLLDRAIMPAGPGWYQQCGLSLSTETLLHVLREDHASRGGATRSLLYRETGSRAGTVGGALLAIAIIGLVEGRRNNANDAYLGWGIGLTTFSIINAISSEAALKRSLRRYNQAVSPTGGTELEAAEPGK